VRALFITSSTTGSFIAELSATVNLVSEPVESGEIPDEDAATGLIATLAANNDAAQTK
jgi:hypothetical protein